MTELSRDRKTVSLHWRMDIDGFLLLATGNGKILYVSSSVEQHLGHRQTDMIGHSLLLFIYPSDVGSVYKQLESQILLVKETGSPQRFHFICQMKEQQRSHSESSAYHPMKFTCYMTHSNNQRKSDEQDGSSLDFVLKAFVEPLQSQVYKEMSLIDAVQDEYITRHNPDGTIVFADHRLSTITGHLPHEVCGDSAYKYIRTDDILIAMFAHKMMFNNGKGLIVYRLRTRNNEYVYLRTMGYVQYESSSSEIEYFTCINKLLTEEEGRSELQKFNERFSPHISRTTASSLYEIISLSQESKKSSPLFCEDKSFSSSDEYTNESELQHSTSFLTPKLTIPNTIPSSPPAKLMTKYSSENVKESLASPFSTNAPSSIIPTTDGKSCLTEDWQSDASSKYFECTSIPPSGKTKVYCDTNKDTEDTIKAVYDIEKSYCNGIRENGIEEMEMENLFCENHFLNHEEKQLYCEPLAVYNSLFLHNMTKL